MDAPLIYDRNSVQIYRMNDRVYYRAGDLEHRRQCNGGFLLLEDSTVAIDAPSVEGAQEMLQESMELFGRPIQYVLLTHAHPDHDLGLPVFVKNGNITLFAAQSARAELEAQGIRYPDRFVGIDGVASLKLGDMEITLETVGVTAHSPWDMLVHLSAFDIMFTGDLIACEPVLYLEHCCLNGWIETLERLKKKRVTTFARGHGGCIDGSYIEKELAYLCALQSVNRKLHECFTVREEDIRDDFMGELLQELCKQDCPGARLLYEISGEAAFYQLFQFYRYHVAP